MKRLFAAIKPVPDDEFLDTYRSLRQSLRYNSIKWVEEENLHITIKFFGETDENMIPDIGHVLGSVSATIPDFSFRYNGLGIFGSTYNPRVIWVAIQPYEMLSGVIQLIKKELVLAGFPDDRQNPVPHLTLGRIRSIRDRSNFCKVMDSYNEISSHQMIADRLILFESILRNSGPEYHIVQSHRFKK